jgi:hypothetical protein
MATEWVRTESRDIDWEAETGGRSKGEKEANMHQEDTGWGDDVVKIQEKFYAPRARKPSWIEEAT